MTNKLGSANPNRIKMSRTCISTKKLKAIVFTDIVDFTKLSAKDEQKALEVIDRQRDLLKPVVFEHKGEWLKEIGDGLLFSFDSSLDAVNCSIKIQQSLKDIEDFNIRIGIHQGDIFIKDGDVFGDDVNIAARIVNFSPIGGIAISDKVDKDIAGVKNIKTSFIGHKNLKGVYQETKIKYISSHSLPKYKINFLPKLIYYSTLICGFIYAFIFIIQLVQYDINGRYFLDDLGQAHSQFQSASMFFLLAYLLISYYKGISNLPLKYTVYFSYVYIFLFLLVDIIIPLIISTVPLKTKMLILMAMMGTALIAFLCSLLLNKIITSNSISKDDK